MKILDILEEFTKHIIKDDNPYIKVNYKGYYYRVDDISYDLSTDSILLYAEKSTSTKASEVFKTLKPFDPVIYKEQGYWKKGLFDKFYSCWEGKIVGKDTIFESYKIFPYELGKFLEDTDIKMGKSFSTIGIEYNDILNNLIRKLRIYSNKEVQVILPNSKILNITKVVYDVSTRFDLTLFVE